MNRIITIILIAFLFGFSWSLAQEEDPVEDNAVLNPYYNSNHIPVFQEDYPIENSNWQWLHPSPQGNTLRWVKAFDENTWYAIGYSGTFMKTTDAGANWEIYLQINGLNSSGTNRNLYSAHFFDMNTGLVCGNSGIVLRTTDGGTSWDSVGVDGTSAATWYGMYFVDSNLGFVSGTTSGRLAVTTDGGLTWTANATIPSGTYYNVHAVDADTIIVSSSGGDIERSTDGGVTWTEIYVGFSSTLYGLNFIDPMNGWVSGSSSHAAYTTDNGLTWTDVSTGLEVSTYYDIDFVTSVAPPTLDEGFEDMTFPPTGWHTKNILGSNEWSRSTASSHTGSASARISYQGTGGDDWLVTPLINIVSGDSLSFWVRKVFSSTYDPDSLEIYVSTTDTAIGSFTDLIYAENVNNFNTSWDRMSVDLNSYAGMSVYIAFRHWNVDGNGMYIDDIQVGQGTDGVAETAVYLTGDSFYLQKTTDNGTTWEDIDILDPLQPWTSTFYSTDFVPEVVMDDSILVTVGTRGLINRKGTGAAITFTNWIAAGTFYDIWAESKIGNSIAVGSPGIAGSTFDQSIYSTNGGMTWSVSTINGLPSEDFNDISMLSSTVGWVAGDEGGIWKTTDGGATWDSLANVGTNLEEVFFVDANTGYAYGASGDGWKSTDGGLTWTSIDPGHGTSIIRAAYFLDANLGYTVGSSGKMYKTTDGGTTTTALDPEMSTSTIYSVHFVDANTGFLCGSSGKVRSTTDGGADWDTIDVGVSTTLYDIEFRDGLNGTVVGSSGRTFFTTDGGLTWDLENSGGSTLYGVSLENTSPDTAAAFVCGSLSYVLKNETVIVPVELANFSASVNGNTVTLNWLTATEINNAGFEVERKSGKDWTNVGYIEGHGTTTEPQVYSFVDAGLTVGEYNYRIKQVDYDGSYRYYNLTEVVNVGAPSDYSLAQNYPNPFNPTTKITYAVPVDGNVTLAVFNMLGEKVATLVNGFTQAGTYNIDFNAGDFSSGVYIYRMEAGDFVSVKKMMLLK